MLRLRMLVLFALIAWTTTLCFADKRNKRDIMFPGYNEPQDFYEPSNHHNHHHHHHQHRPPTRRPGFRGTTPFPDTETRLPNAIPEELMDLLNDVNNLDDYLKYVRRNYSNDSGNINNRFGADDVEKKSVTPYKFAKCEPEEQTVRINIDDPNPRHLYMPQCVRVKRCGGCCTNSIHTCMPVANTTVIYEIMGLEYNYGMELDRKESKYVTVEVHTKCKCMCKGSMNDCTALQRYDKAKCECVCSNKDEQKKCHQNELKQWDPKQCVCICRNMRECSTGSKFNLHTCSCEVVRATKRISESRRRRGDEGTTTLSRTVQPRLERDTDN